MADIVTQVTIENRIFLLRGKKVMLDHDLAELYEVTTGNLNKAVKRNLERFPEDFMFQLSKEELENLIFQFGRSSWGGLRKLPYAFTENGVAMLSGVLNSPRAIQVNIQIMRAFTRMRNLVADNSDLRKTIQNIERRLDSHDQQIQVAFAALKSILQPKPIQPPPEQIPPQVLTPKKRMGFGKDEKKNTTEKPSARHSGNATTLVEVKMDKKQEKNLTVEERLRLVGPLAAEGLKEAVEKNKNGLTLEEALEMVGG